MRIPPGACEKVAIDLEFVVFFARYSGFVPPPPPPPPPPSPLTTGLSQIRNMAEKVMIMETPNSRYFLLCWFRLLDDSLWEIMSFSCPLVTALIEKLVVSSWLIIDHSKECILLQLFFMTAESNTGVHTLMMLNCTY